MNFKPLFFLLFSCFIFCNINAQEISLNGTWSFAIDPQNRGEISGWDKPWKIKEGDTTFAAAGFDLVTVPHTWSLDIRYNYIGKAWYRRGFTLPNNVKDKTVRLHFDGVFYKCRIFLNGELVAYHFGGYTPFNIDISRWVKFPEVNFLSIEVDNSWGLFTIPGSRLGNRPNEQLYPWYDFGGITRDVSLMITSKVYVAYQKIEAVPNLKTGTASVKVISWIENKSYIDTSITVQASITNRTTGKLVQLACPLEQTVLLKAYTKQKLIMEASLKAADVLLWDFDNPNLYDVHSNIITNRKTIAGYDTYFGIREFKVDPTGPRFLLNGKPIRVAGANRHSDHPVYGSTDPLEVANEDMSLLRNGNMIMSRLSHMPLSKYFYKWADENGYLIFAEIPNWHIPPVLMANQKLKDEFRMQMKEMVEAFWNSPSIVAYSTGNEYESWTPEGDEWTRYQVEQYRQLDTTRLLSFVALRVAASNDNLALPHDSFRYCDFININNYGTPDDMEATFSNLHKKYPGKPIFLSEFGQRADFVKNEKERIDYLAGVIDLIKRDPFVAGCSYWTFNDYLSRFPASNKNGYREWGIVDANRKPRGLYRAFQTMLSPVTIKIQKNKITVSAKSDFPSYTISNYKLKIVEGYKVKSQYEIPELAPGNSVEINVGKIPAKSRLVIENNGGIRVFDSESKGN